MIDIDIDDDDDDDDPDEDEDGDDDDDDDDDDYDDDDDDDDDYDDDDPDDDDDDDEIPICHIDLQLMWTWWFRISQVFWDRFFDDSFQDFPGFRLSTARWNLLSFGEEDSSATQKLVRNAVTLKTEEVFPWQVLEYCRIGNDLTLNPIKITTDVKDDSA